MTSVLVASTIPVYKCRGRYWGCWLENAEQIRLEAKHEADADVGFYAALQHDARGHRPFWELLGRVNELDGAWDWFSLDTGATEWTSENRLAGICTGRNLAIFHALEAGSDWIYFADSDITAPDEIIPKLLELDWPVCGADVPTYCLDGPRDDARPEVDARWHWNTAGSLLVAREVFRQVPWRIDPDANETDDPATQTHMAKLGYPTLVRHDIHCEHQPASIQPLERRDHDRTIHR